MTRRNSWVWFFLFGVACADAHIKINVKSAALSRALRDEPKIEEKTHQNTTESPLSRVALDLSGRFRCHLTEPHMERIGIDDGETPLFRFGRRRWKAPSLLIGVDYDFNSVWHGANQVSTTLRWKIANRHESGSYCSTREDEDTTTPSLFSPEVVRISFEKSLLQPNDYALDLGFEWESRDPWSPPMSLVARLDNKRTNSLQLFSPIHRRLNVMLKSYFSSDSVPRNGIASSRIPKWVPGVDPWIPSLTVDPKGALASKVDVGLNPAWTRNRNMGLRVTVKRQLDWSLVGCATERDENETFLRVEIGSGGCKGYTAIKCEALMEHIVDTACITFERENRYFN